MSDFDRMITLIASGNAILFTGAGFSHNCTNIKGERPLLSTDLSKKIAMLGGYENDTDDLRYISDRFLQEKNPHQLIEFLCNTYKLRSISSEQKTICAAKWRRFYTTNYDSSIEMALAQNGSIYTTVTTDKHPRDYHVLDNLCVHINGSIDDITPNNLFSTIKLSNASYVSADDFFNSPWYYFFQNHIDKCSAIVFVGYSLYDIEIQKILKAGPDRRQKTFFIVSPSASEKEKYTLSQYGIVFPIGLTEFASKIDENSTRLTSSPSFQWASLNEYTISNEKKEFGDNDATDFLLHGMIDQALVDDAISTVQSRPLMIRRKQSINQITELLKRSNVTVSSEFGNGKTILLMQALPQLAIDSYSVFTVSDTEGDLLTDIEQLERLNKRAIVVIDGAEQTLHAIKHLRHIQPKNVRFLLAARSTEIESIQRDLSDSEIKFKNVNIDQLNDDEVGQLIEIFDFYGLWPNDSASWGLARKTAYLRHDCKQEIVHVLLNLFDAPQIKARIGSILKELVSDEKFKETIFMISFLSFIDIKAYDSTVARLSGNDSIFSPELTGSPFFRQLFRKSRNHIITKSGPFSLSTIKNHFEASFTLRMLHKIAETLSSIKDEDDSLKRIFNATLRFSSIEKLLNETNKARNLIYYYEHLKNHVPWLIADPHYWLQYGMAYVSINDLDTAQKKIDYAYGLAHKKDQYVTDKLDNQQARLHFLYAVRSRSDREIFDRIQKGHKLLSPLQEDVYKYRQYSLLVTILDSSYIYLSAANKTKFREICISISNQIRQTLKRETSFKLQQTMLNLYNAFVERNVIPPFKQTDGIARPACQG